MLYSTARALKYLGALGSCAAFAVCTVYVMRSEAQGKEASRRLARLQTRVRLLRSSASKFRPATAIGDLISVAHEEGTLNDIRAILGK